MNINFSIHFNTTFGQELYITGSIPELGCGDISKGIKMDFTDSYLWKKEVRIVSVQERIISYRYFVKDSCGNSFYEVGEERKLGISSLSKDLYLIDQWQGNTPTAPFLTTPFSDVFFTHNNISATQIHTFSQELIIRVTAPNIEKNAAIYICGDNKEMGNWDASKAPAMTPVYGSKWEIHLNAATLPKHISYKFIKKYNNGEVIWEDSDNRELQIEKIAPHNTLSVEHSFCGFKILSPKFYGTAIPLFSLRSKNSCGIGDFIDLKLFTEWLKITGQNILQILPINDTTDCGKWTDSYPYGGISVMALHPIYINIKEIGAFQDKEVSILFNKERKALNSLPQIDYEAVLEFKIRYLKIQFAKYSEDSFAEPEFYSFYKSNKSWLLPYCVFCTLRDQYKSADFSKWGKYSTYSPDIIENFNKKGKKTYQSISFHLFIQYHLHKQLLEAVKYAHKNGIAIKGDIPIGITPHSVDAWTDSKYFNMNSQAGAPPDDFSANGQNWGFPTYNWEEMARDDFKWWKNRFKKMSEYFDAYRIDHVLGFFRIWEIPSHQTKGLMGHFSPSLPLSYEEINRFGYRFDFIRDTKPFIRYYMLKEIFGSNTDLVINTYLDSPQYEVFTLKEEYNTQRKIEDFFGGKKDSIKDGLISLVSEVLFLEDPNCEGRFHPRISAQFTYSFRSLNWEQQRAFNSLYDDFFYKRHNIFWQEQAFGKLPKLISSTNMLTCAEDLGMIPDCVPLVLNKLRMLSLEIQRMPKDPKIKFAEPKYYPYLSVCSTGTHDTSTIRGWWEEDRASTQLYFNTILKENGEAPVYCEPWICEKIIRQHIDGGSLLTIIPFQDWLSIDEKIRLENPHAERINIPSNPHHYWRYRMHLTIEELIDNKEFNNKLLCLNSHSPGKY